MGKLYTTMQGKQVDMEKLALKNELTPAVGNARVNARGDELGPGGQIIRKREDILADYYAKNPRAVRDDILTRQQRPDPKTAKNKEAESEE